MQIISRKNAKLRELVKFYTGKPCRNGHDSERYTGSGTCVGCIYQANGHSLARVTIAPDAASAPAGPSKASMLSDLIEQRFRTYHVDVPALQRMAVSLCLAVHPTLTEDDARSRKGALKAGGPTAMYSFRFPPAMQPMMQALAVSMFEKHSQANVDQFRANLVQAATEIALEERPPIPEWKYT